MRTFEEALQKGFIKRQEEVSADNSLLLAIGADTDSSWHFDFADGENKYELWFEKLLWDNQYYVALYKNHDLLTEKVVVKPGYIKKEETE